MKSYSANKPDISANIQVQFINLHELPMTKLYIAKQKPLESKETP